MRITRTCSVLPHAMIVSHRHRFIFLKTRKTAGTSLEIHLSQCCGDEDIVTPFGVPEPGHRPRNHEGCYNHMTAAEIRARIGHGAWNDYFKFCFERNPWDKVVSHYFFVKGRQDLPDLRFEDFIAQGGFPVDSPAYRLDGAVAMDRIGRYETLGGDIADICMRLGIPAPDPLPHAKAHYRDSQAAYRDFYDAGRRAVVAQAFAWEIAQFGYGF